MGGERGGWVGGNGEVGRVGRMVFREMDLRKGESGPGRGGGVGGER